MIIVSFFILVFMCFYFYSFNRNLKNAHENNMVQMRSIFSELEVKNKLLNDKLFINSSFESSYQSKSIEIRTEIVALQKILFQNIK